MPLLILTLLALLLIAWFVWQPRIQAWRRRRTQADPFPSAWRAILRRRVPAFARLPAALQLQLKKQIQVFLAEKEFIGCQGQAINDEVRVTIAAQACMLLLGRPEHHYPSLRQVLVYPGAFRIQREHTSEDGVVQSRRDVLVGESWEQGQVILSWDDVLHGAADPHDGWNVVLHEFAHQLDSESGLTNGAPDLGSAQRYARWSRVMQAAYDRLCEAVDRGLDTFLDPYAATDPAEFFAVITETFFEQGPDLRLEHPDLYAELKAFYQVDPASW